MPTTTTTCPCHQNPALCAACVRRGLADAHRARLDALRLREDAARAYQPATVLDDFEELQDEALQWRIKLQRLQQRHSDMALCVARRNVALEEKREALRTIMGDQQQELPHHPTKGPDTAMDDDTTNHSSITTTTTVARDRLMRLQSSVLSSLDASIQATRHDAQRLRWSWALQALKIHRLDVQLPRVRHYEQQQQQQQQEKDGDGSDTLTPERRHLPRRRIARGIGKISGLVLPHAGPELFGVLPPDELTSALRLVASVTKLVAQCLGVSLPHPIWLQPPPPPQSPSSSSKKQQADLIRNDSDIINLAANEELDCASLSNDAATTSIQQPRSDLSSSLLRTATSASSSLIGSFLGQSKSMLRRAMTATSAPTAAAATSPSHYQPTAQTRTAPCSVAQPSMDPRLVKQRVRHAHAAILQDDPHGPAVATGGGSYYALTPQQDDAAPEDFMIAWQLLQHNVVSLCIRAGVPVHELWPAEAVLLNLYALEQFGKRLLAHGCEEIVIADVAIDDHEEE